MPTTRDNASSPSRPFSSPSQSARRAARHDLNRALRLLRRSPGARAFLLTPPPASLDLALLASAAPARPHFTIATEDVQRGSLAGRIALRYLGLPAFSDAAGLSGGLVVTTYASRTHPLHAPAVMAHVRVGRYVRDNASGDWCILTRNRRDRLTRLQYITTTGPGAAARERERVCLTCSSDLFDRGRMLDSLLFRCHDTELRVCARCALPLCTCHAARAAAPARAAPGLAALAHTVVNEGAAEWLGTVRVTVASNLSNNPVLNIDETMTVRSSYTPTIDAVLASEMRRLAIIETATHATTVPSALPVAALSATTAGTSSSGACTIGGDDATGAAQHAASVPDAARERANASAFDHAASTAAAFEMSRFGAAAVADPTFDDVFTMEDTTEVANHFLVMQESAISDALSEAPMLPADPSTLPGGIDHCLEGMELEPEDYSYFAAPSAAQTGLANEEVVANALSGADIENLFLPSALDNLDKLADVERCATPAGPSVEAVAVARAERDGAAAAAEPPSPEPEDRSCKRLKREAVETAETMSSLTLGSTGSGCSKSAATSDASATERGSLAELSPAPSTDQSPVEPPRRGAAPQASSSATPVARACPPLEEREAECASAASTPAASTPLTTPPPQVCNAAAAPPSRAQGAERVPPAPGSRTASPNAAAQPMQHAPPHVVAPVPMPVAAMRPFIAAPVSGMQNATAAPMAAPGLFHGAAMLGPAGPWLVAPDGAGGTPGACAIAAGAPRLAPRPKGMPNDGFIWQMGSVPVAAAPALAYAIPAQVARWQQLERERKAEERRKKNRQAAARSNARKKCLMDGYRAEIAAEQDKVDALLAREAELRRENDELKRRLGRL